MRAFAEPGRLARAVAATSLTLAACLAVTLGTPGGALGGAAAASPCPSGLAPFGKTPSTPPAKGAKAAAPVARYLGDEVQLGSTKAVVGVLVTRGNGKLSLLVQYGSGLHYFSCSTPLQLVVAPGEKTGVQLTGLLPGRTYHYRLVATNGAGTAYRADRTFTTLAGGTIAQHVSVGGLALGGKTRAEALTLLERPLASPLRMGYNGALWRVPRTQAGAQLDAAGAVDAALRAAPGTSLPASAVTVDAARLRAYIARLDKRWSHKPVSASVKLVGTRAVIVPARPGVRVDTPAMTAALLKYLQTGQRHLLRLAVTKISQAKAPVEKAVVVRLGPQLLTAYENGKPVLRTPVTTGRPALPTPVGSYYIHFRASPYTFISPWPQGSPYYYPPAPVTWAMYFYDNDFLHDDPAEPESAYGEGSNYGPYASHGCVHVPHDAMAWLFNWLPIGAPVIVSQS
jgi:lipoprotein-anchoring transpeptidase ErfK/SrfK